MEAFGFTEAGAGLGGNLMDTSIIYMSCYGAYFASQVRDHIRDGRGAPLPEDFEGFCEEACEVASVASAAFDGAFLREKEAWAKDKAAQDLCDLENRMADEDEDEED